MRWLMDQLLAQADGDGGGILDRPLETIPLVAVGGTLIAGGVKLFRFLTRTVLDSQSRQVTDLEARLRIAVAEVDTCHRRLYALERLLAKHGIDTPEEP